MDFDVAADGKSIKVVVEDQVYLLVEKHSKWSPTTQLQFQSMTHSDLELIGDIAVVSK